MVQEKYEVQYTFKTGVEGVTVCVDWTHEGECNKELLDRTAREKLVQAGLPADLEEAEF